MRDLLDFRSDFPILSHRTYLISGSLGPLSTRSRALAEEHLDLWQRLGPEELWFDHAFPRLDQCRAAFARLIGADEDEIAIVPSVSAGLSALATCLDLTGRPKIVASDMDFPTNHHVWQAHAARGAELDVIASGDRINVEPEAYCERIDERTAVVNTNRVLFESSRIVDLEPIIAAAHEAGAYVLTDDFHGSGMVPIDVHRLNVDFLLSGCLKWLCGGQGLAFLYVRRDLIEKMEPLVVGWFGTENPFDFDRSGLRRRKDARRFETGTFALPQAWTALGGLEVIEAAGVDRIRERSRELTRHVIDRADEAGLEVMSPRDDDHRGGLVRVAVPGGRPAAEKVLHELFEHDVVLDQRGGALRISPHFFNTPEEIDHCFDVLQKVL